LGSDWVCQRSIRAQSGAGLGYVRAGGSGCIRGKAVPADGRERQARKPETASCKAVPQPFPPDRLPIRKPVDIGVRIIISAVANMPKRGPPGGCPIKEVGPAPRRIAAGPGPARRHEIMYSSGYEVCSHASE